MCKSSEQVRHRNHASGFTLLEIAIVLIIIGVFMAPVLQLYKSYQERKIFAATQASLAEGNNALSVFYTKNSRYTCPAPRGVGPQTPGYGQEDCAPGVATGSCDPVTAICRVAGINAGKTVLVGAVPFVTLEMQGIHAQDGYHKKMQYMVTEDLVNAATFNPATQEIQEVDSAGNNVATLQGVIFSTGQNAKGAYSIEGGAIPCTPGTLDDENCDNDNVIIDGVYSNSNNASYYDDSFNIQAWLNTEIWSYVPGSSTEIQNNNTGNIGINTTTPSEKLEVVGNVRITSDVYAQQLCRDVYTDPVTGVKTGVDCFSPDMIGGPAGTAIQCAVSGQAMTGISSGTAQCGNVGIPALANKSCSGATPYVTGFDSSGNLTCGP